MSTAALTGGVVILFVCQVLVRYLTESAVGKYPAQFVLQMVLLEVPYLIGLLLPIGFYLAILLVYGRMYSDNEIPVLFSSGMSKKKLVAITMSLALLVSLIVGYISFWVSPTILHWRHQLRYQAATAAIVQMLTPGKFHQLGSGKEVLYVKELGRDRQSASGFFIARKNQQDKYSWDIITAKRGQIEEDADSSERFVALYDGYRYKGVAGRNDFQVIKFKKYGLQLPQNTSEKVTDPRALPTKELFTNTSKVDYKKIAELQWRISVPLSVWILALLALPMSEIKPRKGRYQKVLPAVICYIVYANLLFLGKSMVSSNKISPILGLWWIHGLFLIIALIMIFYPSIYRRVRQLL